MATSTPTAESYEITVKALANQEYKVKVEPSFTIGKVKDIVQQSHGIPHNQQRYVFHGTMCEDSKTLAEYNVGKDSILNVVLRLD